MQSRRPLAPLPYPYRDAIVFENRRPLCLCLGDSITYGSGVCAEQTWPSQLGKFLSGGRNAIDASVINAGISGFSILDNALHYQFFLRYLKPDIIVWQVCENDAELIADPSPQTYRTHVAATWGEDAGHLTFMRQGLNRMMQFAGCPVLMLYAGSPESAVDLKASALIADECEQRGIHFVNGLDITARIAPRNRRVGPEDDHPSAFWHRLVGKTISNEIKRMAYPLPLTQSAVGDLPASSRQRQLVNTYAALAWAHHPRSRLIDRLLLGHKAVLAAADDRFSKSLRTLLGDGAGLFSDIDRKPIRELTERMERILVRFPEMDHAIRPAWCLTRALDQLLHALETLKPSPLSRALYAFGGRIDTQCYHLIDQTMLIGLLDEIENETPDAPMTLRLRTEREAENHLHGVFMSVCIRGKNGRHFQRTHHFWLPEGDTTHSLRLPEFELADIEFGIIRQSRSGEHLYTDFGPVKEIVLQRDDRVLQRWPGHRLSKSNGWLKNVASLLNAACPHLRQRCARLDHALAQSNHDRPRLALYSAGEATRKALREIDFSGWALVAIIDRQRRGRIDGLPIVTLQAGLELGLDFILVTSDTFWVSIKQDLEASGLSENQHFALLS